MGMGNNFEGDGASHGKAEIENSVYVRLARGSADIPEPKRIFAIDILMTSP